MTDERTRVRDEMRVRLRAELAEQARRLDECVQHMELLDLSNLGDVIDHMRDMHGETACFLARDRQMTEERR